MRRATYCFSALYPFFPISTSRMTSITNLARVRLLSETDSQLFVSRLSVSLRVGEQGGVQHSTCSQRASEPIWEGGFVDSFCLRQEAWSCRLKPKALALLPRTRLQRKLGYTLRKPNASRRFIAPLSDKMPFKRGKYKHHPHAVFVCN